MPVTKRVERLLEHETERLLPVDARGEREGFVHRVAEAGVDIPTPRRVVVGGQPIDGEHEMVACRLLVWTGRTVHAADVTLTRVSQRPQQQPERSVQVVAV